MSSNLIIIFGLLCGGIFSLLLGGTGIFLIIRWQRSKLKVQESTSWETVVGEISKAELLTRAGIDERNRYVPSIHYRYQVGDQSFEGDQIAIGGDYQFKFLSQAEDKLRHYLSGSEVTVFYNPENPAEAVLEREVASTQGGLIVGILLTVLMLCLLCPLVYFVFDLVLRSS